MAVEDRAEQRRRALELAREARTRQAEIKRRLRDGELDPIALVKGEYEDLEPLIQRWRLERLLLAIPGIGAVSLVDICATAQASPSTRVSAFSFARREEIAGYVAKLTGREEWSL